MRRYPWRCYVCKAEREPYAEQFPVVVAVYRVRRHGETREESQTADACSVACRDAARLALARSLAKAEKACARCGAGTVSRELEATRPDTPSRCRCTPSQMAAFRARQGGLFVDQDHRQDARPERTSAPQGRLL